MAYRINRAAYADMFGPTVGDKVRLADTELFVEVEEDRTIYGEEVKFGGGKVIRDGMGQSQVSRAGGAVDTVITNALIVDHTGIIRADIGIRDGRIVGVGKAGNPDTQPGVDIIVGPGTEAIAGEGKIITAGGFDAHIHFICPQLIEEALTSGVTTMLGGGTGPVTGTNATTCTPGPWHIGRMLQAFDSFPVNLGLSGKGNASTPEALREQVITDRRIAAVSNIRRIRKETISRIKADETEWQGEAGRWLYTARRKTELKAREDAEAAALKKSKRRN